MVLCARLKSLTVRDVIRKGVERKISGCDEVGFLSGAVKGKEFEGGVSVLESVEEDNHPFTKSKGGGSGLEFYREVAGKVNKSGALVGSLLCHWEGTSGGGWWVGWGARGRH